MEAARTAGDRGHDVTLIEKNEKLGGALNMAVSPDFKADLKSYLQWSIRMTKGHPGIKMRLATEATPELVEHETPDALVIAVGAEASMPTISGLDGVNVVWVGDVETGNVQVGDKVKTGEPLAVFHSDGDDEKIKPAKAKFIKAYTISPDRIDPPKFFHARITREGVEEL